MRIDYAAKDSCPLKTPPFSNTNSSCWPDRRGHSSSWTADVATKKSPSACDIMVKLLTENIKKYETRKFSALNYVHRKKIIENILFGTKYKIPADVVKLFNS